MNDACISPRATAEPPLHARAAELIRDGRLPCRAPDRIFGGYGVGNICGLCAALVGVAEQEYELEFLPPGSGTPTVIHLHFRCFAIWEYERIRVAKGAAAVAYHPPA
ncbi:MAG: hypothetical protein JOY77_01360 [Alphaproteobacteria bacterium]|nr:hypothetical protein [Alphaproteobacteria bacterium]